MRTANWTAEYYYFRFTGFFGKAYNGAAER